jgi:ribosome-associated protein
MSDIGLMVLFLSRLRLLPPTFVAGTHRGNMTKKITRKDATIVLIDSIIEGMQERKAKDIVVIDLRNIDFAMTDYFVICHGTSTTQVQAIAQSVEEQSFKLSNEKPWHIEGQRQSNWILMDYVNVVVHVFEDQTRKHYALEDLWSDGVVEKIASSEN